MEQVRRASAELEQIARLCEINEMLRNISTITVDNESLQSLSVIIGETLDVDEKTSPEFLTSFFRPCQVTVSDLQDEIWQRQNMWIDAVKGECAAWQYPESKSGWFTDCLVDLMDIDPSIWYAYCDRTELAQATGLRLPAHVFWESPYRPGSNEYLSQWAFFPVQENKPHIACLMWDSAIPPNNELLRSEVHAAITLSLHQFRTGCFADHHTKPVRSSVSSLTCPSPKRQLSMYPCRSERNWFARITQAHFEGKKNKLILRISRQLDLRGTEPTPDAYILLRWMANTPIGETEYKDSEGGAEQAAEGGPPAAPKISLGYT